MEQERKRIEMWLKGNKWIVKIYSDRITAVPQQYIGSNWERTMTHTLHKHYPHYPQDTEKVILSTNNVTEMICRAVFPKLQGAKLVKNEKHPNYDQDPYGRYIQRGTIVFQEWDLRGVYK